MDFNTNNDQGKFRDKAKNFFDRQGFYIVLFACIAILGITAFFTYRGMRKEVPQSEAMQSAQPANLSKDEQLMQAASHTPIPTLSPTNSSVLPEKTTYSTSSDATPDPTPTPKKTGATKKKKTPALYAPPVDGKLMQAYSADALVYSKTLNQWTSHLGIDIEANEGAVVRAIDAGIVSRVEKNTMLGYCIAIKHETGLTSVYCNLSDLPIWKKGDAVKTGDILGNVGNSAISESSDLPHLHFELFDGEKPIDPTTRLQSFSDLPSTESTLAPAETPAAE